MAKPNVISKLEGRLTLGDVLRMLVNDGIVEKNQAEQLYKDRKLDRSNLHPLVVIGEQKWKNLTAQNKPLTVETLTGWMAERAGLDYYHVDPLKLDFGSIAQIVSKDYAERLKIMPVKVQANIATIATAEPFLTEWVPDLERVLGMKIKLVMTNPLDINRYLPEIYSLANSINLASTAKAGQIVGVQNFEQLVELGNNKNLDANEQHIVNIVDWIFKYAFEQRASDIHLEPRRNIGFMRFRIDGILHQV
ncbi:MAG: type II/IV secretion system protein, partial [Nitrosomonadales bacterium]|nr:type II/IV secretion system protein [Nitrosomonadales bacterium]